MAVNEESFRSARANFQSGAHCVQSDIYRVQAEVADEQIEVDIHECRTVSIRMPVDRRGHGVGDFMQQTPRWDRLGHSDRQSIGIGDPASRLKRESFDARRVKQTHL
ncbi:hypothetical protein AruPA_18780 [Acidiphilium sp. PA]|uniref:hypothetical protein n=1 Tax=Acidiphilium sp. PA TaxID=2871705 RepID=UPI00224307DA|nr:hypothetical protein [Acidiphilium sp. PA]MCW8309083.1 hypothetical protein [Acidiphilium sp. PA]